MDNSQINKALNQMGQVPAATGRTPSGDGRLLAISLRAKTLRRANDEEIAEAMKYCMAVIGIRANNLPTQEEKALLISFVKRNFAGNTTAELKLAFDMAAAGKLHIDARAFENFSCIYISGIMEAYRSWAAEEVKHLELDDDQSKKISELSGPVDWTDEWNKCIEMAFSDDFNDHFIPSSVYEWLDSKGEFSLSAVDKWGYVEKARTKYISDLKNGGRPDLSISEIKFLVDKMTRGDWKNDLTVMSRLINISKQLIVKDHARKTAKANLSGTNRGPNNKNGH